MNSPLAFADTQRDPLAGYRWKARVLVVLSTELGRERVAEQRREIEALKNGAAERDLVVVQAPSGSPDEHALRIRFGFGMETFIAVLVGKDGGAKLRSTKPITAGQLIATIDAMPMRQGEAHARNIAFGLSNGYPEAKARPLSSRNAMRGRSCDDPKIR